MKLSRLIQFLDPAAMIYLDGQPFAVAEVRGWFREGGRPIAGGDPEVALRVRDYTLDLYDKDRPHHRQHWGWIELAREG
jgi:hypothetical protein